MCWLHLDRSTSGSLNTAWDTRRCEICYYCIHMTGRPLHPPCKNLLVTTEMLNIATTLSLTSSGLNLWVSAMSFQATHASKMWARPKSMNYQFSSPAHQRTPRPPRHSQLHHSQARRSSQPQDQDLVFPNSTWKFAANFGHILLVFEEGGNPGVKQLWTTTGRFDLTLSPGRANASERETWFKSQKGIGIFAWNTWNNG